MKKPNERIVQGGSAIVILLTMVLLRMSEKFHFSFDKATSRLEENKGSISTPYCRTAADILQGAWEKSTFDSADLVPCCGWDSSHFQQTPEVCGKEPMPKSEGIYHGRAEFLAHTGGRSCICPVEHIQAMNSYKWVPRACLLHEFEPINFCKHLGNRTILLVGDSTMEQAASTLMNAAFPEGTVD